MLYANTVILYKWLIYHGASEYLLTLFQAPKECAVGGVGVQGL